MVVDNDGSHPLTNPEPVEDGDALVMVTSGTTGTAKGVVLTHEALRASSQASNEALGVSDADHWLACLPLSHVGGLSVVVRSIHGGTRLTVLPGFDFDRVNAAAGNGCNLVSLVPTTLRRIDPSIFRLVLLGGSRPPADRPGNVVATYGLTETASGVVYEGRPLEGVELSIATDDEILVRGPMLMRCYRDGTTSIDAAGWLHTGDVGSLNDGRLEVRGRLDDLIKTGGEKVWPDAVERALGDLVDNGSYCIVGIDDDEWGQKVVLVTTDPTLRLEDVRGRIRESLPSFCEPKAVVHLESLPATSLGKIRRRECASLAARELHRST